MAKVVVLDTSPLGLLTQSETAPSAVAINRWLSGLLASGVRVVVPEVADFELRRELLRLKRPASVTRLDIFNAAVPDRYVPITTEAMLLAAELWAQVRQQGLPTADPKSLDADVILAAQTLTLGVPADDLIVATSNVSHLTRFVAADAWHHITV